MDEFKTNISITQQLVGPMNAFIRVSYALRVSSFTPWRIPLITLVLMLGLLVLGGRSAWAQSAFASQEGKALIGQNISASPSPQDEVRLAEGTMISLHLDNVSIEEAVQHIAAIAGLKPSYGSRAVAAKEKVTLDLEQVTVHEALQEVTQGVGLEALILHGNRLVLFESSKVELEPSKVKPIKIQAIEGAPLYSQDQQQGTISGTVTDSLSGEPIPGVNVVIAGTQQGSATDAEGQYTISSVEPGTYALRASFVGYSAKTVEGVEVEEGQTTEVDFQLVESAVALDEIVAIGYGEQRRRDLTGSLAEISTEEVAEMPVTRLDEVLQGSASGVQVIQNSGAPGSEATIRIRGTNSINAGSDPLVVIDGFPGAGDLSSINPKNVESIQVLKDASATAIYGARGAGGVVLVTTKQGAAGEPRVNFNTSFSLQSPSNKLDLLNAREYARLVNEANVNAGQSPEFENPESLGAGTDWQDQIFRTGLRQEHQLSVSGGSQNIRYLISGSYVDQEGIVRNSFFNRGNVRLNLDADISDRLRIGNNITLSRVGQNQLGGSSVRDALLYRPTMDVRDEEGNYTEMRVPQLTLENPIAGVEEPRIDNTTSSGLGNVFAEYTIIEGLELRSGLGGEVRYLEDKEYIPTTLQAGRLSGGEATVVTEEEFEWVSQNTINFNRVFAERHDIELLAGYTFQAERNEFVQTGASQFANERLGFNALSVGAVRSEPQTGISESTLQSFLFRANYQLNDKYLFTATGRYDGSSKFGEGNRYGFFPSGSIAWRLSEEAFLKNVDFLTDLKLRTSYGVTGNQEIGTYAALARLASTATAFGNETRIGVEPTRVANPELKWEETSQLDIGVDATLFGEQLSLTADYYLKQTSDLLLAVALPSQTGFSSTVRNVGGVQNEGVEISVDVGTRLGPVTWNSNINMTRNINEVTNLGDNNEIFPGTNVGAATSAIVNFQSIIIREGEPLGSFYGFVQEGLFQSQDEIQNSAQPNAEIGEPRFRDVNEDGVIDDADKQILGNGQADTYGSFSNTFSYGGFNLSIMLRGSFGKDIMNNSRLELESLSGATNNMTTVKDRWTPENTNTDLPKANATGYSFDITSRIIEDGSYIRLQNLSMSYDIPQEWLGSLRNASIYVTGTNLYTFTGYSGYDPEVNFQGTSNVAYSIDYQPYPRARSFTLGLNLGI